MNEYQSEVDVYQEKEVPRHLEDIKKVMAQLDQLSENLEKSKEEAMVSRTVDNIDYVNVVDIYYLWSDTQLA